MINFETYTNETQVSVSKMTLTIVDKRTGKFADKVFYRPVDRFPVEMIERELAPYGYEVLGYKEADVVHSTMDWEQVFEYMTAMQNVEATHDAKNEAL